MQIAHQSATGRLVRRSRAPLWSGTWPPAGRWRPRSPAPSSPNRPAPGATRLPTATAKLTQTYQPPTRFSRRQRRAPSQATVRLNEVAVIAAMNRRIATKVTATVASSAIHVRLACRLTAPLANRAAISRARPKCSTAPCSASGDGPHPRDALRPRPPSLAPTQGQRKVAFQRRDVLLDHAGHARPPSDDSTALAKRLQALRPSASRAVPVLVRA